MKETSELLIKDSTSTAKEAVHQIAATVVTEAHTHSDLHTACSTTVKPTIAQKIAPYSLSPKGKWSKTPNNYNTLCYGRLNQVN
jgi:hypothetical protein